jgi:signal transduction histidine kinase
LETPKLKNLILLLFFTLFASISEAQEIGFPTIRNYTPKEYNNSTQIFGAVQDVRGVFYFGVTDGLMEYDGVSWRTISNKKQAYTYDLAKDKNGKIYVGANNEFGYLATDSIGNTIYKSLTHLLRDKTFKLGAVWSVKLTSKYVYFRTYDAILQYSPTDENLHIFKADTNLSFSLDFIYKDTYYAKMFQKGLMKIENNNLTKVPNSDSFQDLYSLAILPYNPTTLLFPTKSNGLFLIEPNKNEPAKKLNISDSYFIPDNSIYSASVFQKDNFLLGSLKKGALLIDKQGKELQHYQESNLLQNNEILKTTSDTNQNIWFGLNNGISKTEHSQDLSFWDKKSGLNGIVESVIRHHKTIYIATSSKVYYIDDKNQIQEIQNISTGQSWCFLETKNTNALLVGVSDGIYEIKNDKAVKIYAGSHITELVQSAINPNRIFATSSGRLISLTNENGKWLSEGYFNGIKDQINGIVEVENGEIWMGTSRNGIIRFTPNWKDSTKSSQLKYYKINAGNSIPFLFKDSLIIGTEKGLFVYNSKTDSFETYNDLGAQFSNVNREIASLIEMPDGKIWISPSENKNEDIGYLQPNNKGSYKWVFAPFRRIPKMDIETFYVEPSGIAWIGGSEGLYRYDYTKDTKNYTKEFSCLIRKITSGSDSLLFGGNKSNLQNLEKPQKLKYESNNLTFEFAAPFFDQEDNTLYSYQLIGYDKEWSKWGRETKKEYSKIHEGNYEFRVKALNIYDVESKIDSFQISILPPWHRTIWAYISYVIFTAALVWLITVLYSRRLKLANIQLERIVEARLLEINQQKEEIQANRDELQTANAEKDKFFNIIAHDLKSPLNSIMGFSEILTKQVGEKNLEGIKKYAEIILKSSESAVKLLKNLMEWAQSQTGRMNYEPVNFNLPDLINENILLFKNITFQKSITIKRSLPQNTTVFADKAMISTVLRNLISNAIKFTHSGGEIIISIQENQNKLKVSVSDNGLGISKANIQKLFRIDENYSTSGTNKEKGTGLGLVLCKEFIEKHSGEIWLESELGKGSTFYFNLPNDAKTNVKNEIEKILPEENLDKHINQEVSGLKILIAEDDDTSKQLNAIIVQKFSKELLHAQTGIEAVDACRNNTDIDLILMDVQMPEMNGYEATRQIRQFNKDVVIIAQTSFGLSGDREKAIEAGCNDYIAKPIKREELNELIQKYFKI